MISKILNRKEKIIISAIDILNESGINGLTTKEIAKRQEITEPAIYRQFTGKKEIIKAILDRYSVYDELIKNTIFDNDILGKEGIMYFAKAYAEYYQNYPAITTVMFSFDAFKYEEDTNEEMKKIVRNRYDLLFKLVSFAMEKGEISPEKNKYVITDAIFSVIWSTTFLWRMSDCNFNVKERIMLAVDNILNS